MPEAGHTKLMVEAARWIPCEQRYTVGLVGAPVQRSQDGCGAGSDLDPD